METCTWPQFTHSLILRPQLYITLMVHIAIFLAKLPCGNAYFCIMLLNKRYFVLLACFFSVTWELRISSQVKCSCRLWLNVVVFLIIMWGCRCVCSARSRWPCPRSSISSSSGEEEEGTPSEPGAEEVRQAALGPLQNVTNLECWREKRIYREIPN